MNKGIVMEMSDRHVIVMTPEGDFRKLPIGGRTCEVGEEILFAEPAAARKVPPMAKLSGLVAAVVMCIVVVTAVTNISGNADVVAYVSMDINPSIEFGIDAAEKVRDLKGLNDDGTKLINGIDYKGKLLEAVADIVLGKAEELGPLAKGEGDIVIASSIVKSTDKISDAAIADKLKQQVTRHIESVHPKDAANYEVTAFAAPQEVRTEAEANGLSTGKYAIYLAAKSNGTSVPLADFKTESIHQLAKDNSGIAAFVNSPSPPAKSVFKELLDEERSGKLDERAKQLAGQKGNNNSRKSDDKGNNGKSDSNNKKAGDSRADDKKSGAGKSDTKNDNKKDSNVRPTTTKPAGDNRSSEQGSSVNNGKTNGQGDGSRNNDNRSDNNKNDDNKAESSKAGAKPADFARLDNNKNDNNQNDNGKKDANKSDSNKNDKSKNDNSKNDNKKSDDNKTDNSNKNDNSNNNNDNNKNDKNFNDRNSGSKESGD